MRDEEYLFKEDVREKAITARSALGIAVAAYRNIRQRR
jgi:hypothetical protein